MSARQTFRELTYTMRPKILTATAKGCDTAVIAGPCRYHYESVARSSVPERGSLRPGCSMKWRIGPPPN
jgi:hypothetical protein